MSANKPTPHPHGADVSNSLGTKVPHPHAESMLLYAQDAMETDRPWVKWSVQDDDSGVWYELNSHPIWNVNYVYRRKARTILINGIEVPEPVKQIKGGQTCWLVDITHPELTPQQYWVDDYLDVRFLERGLIHLTEEHAKKHAEALLSFTKV